MIPIDLAPTPAPLSQGRGVGGEGSNGWYENRIWYERSLGVKNVETRHSVSCQLCLLHAVNVTSGVWAGILPQRVTSRKIAFESPRDRVLAENRQSDRAVDWFVLAKTQIGRE